MAVDIGGTFTDLVARDTSTGSTVRAKVLTTPSNLLDGILEAVEKSGVGLSDVAAVVHGSTIAINAVLQSNGARTALITTRGFRDVLEMGRKSRPDMYNLFFQPRLCLVPRDLRVEVSGRLDHLGVEITAIDAAEVDQVLATIPNDVQAIAITFINSYANPVHEMAVASQVRARRPEAYVTASTEVSGEMREYERTSTSVVNAYVGPLVGRYIDRMANGLRERGYKAPLWIMQSNGGSMSAEVASKQPVRTLESGPAAGVVGAAWVAAETSCGDIIAFDMGGTSAKACVVTGGEPEVSAEYYIGGRLTGVPAQVPFLDIVEVGAGGGSVAYLGPGGRLNVGPRSAGSVPGPAAYSLGGIEPTITDANVVAGRINPDNFLGGAMRLDAGAALAAVTGLGAKLGIGPQACAEAIIKIANSIMANAIRAVTVERGRDPRDFTLVSYGGAGALHATALAAELMIPRVLIPAGAGTFAAFGMLVTDTRHDVARSFVGPLDELSGSAMISTLEALEADAASYLRNEFEPVDDGPPRFIRKVDLRYVGQFHPLTLTLPDSDRTFSPKVIARLFHAAHRERYGHNSPDAPIEATTLRVTAVRPVPKPSLAGGSPNGWAQAPATRRTVYIEEEGWLDCAVQQLATMRPGQHIAGPAVIEDVSTTIILASHNRGQILEGGHVQIDVTEAGC